ncbi:MAG: hypothetical protein IJC73_03235 [Lentisphaeria bacterium]|nr:hypothetical protein [Lentisphaeria bacterium]
MMCRLMPLLAAILLLLAGCEKASAPPVNEVHLGAGGRVRTLDPALADDLASRNMTAAFYDTLLEYEYPAKPYRLVPSMLAEMPVCDADGLRYRFRLRDDLWFPADPCFGGKKRRVTAADVVYSWKRLADARLHSPAYWMLRGKIAGLDEFNRRSLENPDGLYDLPVAGLTVVDDLNFEVRLTGPDPRFLAVLALPNTAVVPPEAVAYYGEGFSEHPVGSGPFRLREWIRDYRLILDRNPDYRPQFYPAAESAADRTRKLPLADTVVCRQIRQAFSGWLLFLQGELDASVLDKDNLDFVAGDGGLSPRLAERGIQLLRAPEFEVRYIGFNCADPKLRDPKLRRALAAAFDTAALQQHLGGLMLPVAGPLPEGVAGFDPDLVNPWQCADVEQARQWLAEAGYPDGIDPATGEPLTFTFDQGNTTSAQRQLGELFASFMERIGVRIVPVLNSAPRFVQKIRQGKVQIFRYSWVGDYPDAENFFQLFYSGNIGGCNRAGFRDAVFDRMYEAVVHMPDSPERTARYREMARYLVAAEPWIFEGVPITYQLKYDWLENYYPHDFAFCRWKYLSVRAGERAERRAGFRPLSFSDLR